MENKFRIDCNKDAFTGQAQHTYEPVALNEKTAQAVNDAETLDRYDEFSDLIIDANTYEKTDASGIYGIEYDENIHEDTVVLPHQLQAAKSFLRDLRGFGLLSDVVGSGKTYESCIVLSELAARGKLQSLLIVVPEQVYEKWRKSVELLFGMGEGALMEIGESFPTNRDLFTTIEIDEETTLKRPRRPMIVKKEDFVKWNEKHIANALFDVVIVDEAHDLCSEKGEGALALKYLSMLMVNKKLVNSTYCLLLSATPHSGNLDKMYRLWYFIRRKGGIPSDYEEKEDSERSEEYNKEKEYYTKEICRGAHTVSEYIAVCKSEIIEDNYKELFEKYIIAKGILPIDFYNDNKYSKWERQNIYEEFLRNAKDGEINVQASVLDEIANRYHSRVLKSIMIRQENVISVKKVVNNIFICPTDKDFLRKQIVENGNEITFDFESLYSDSGVVIRHGSDERRMSVTDYVEKECEGQGEAEIYLSQIFGSEFFDNKKVFDKQETIRYYWEMLDESSPLVKNTYRVLPGYDKDSYKNQTFKLKLEELVKIIEKNPNERIIVFFDYELVRNKSELPEWERVYEELKDTEIGSRLILALANQTEENIDLYKNKKDAVLLAGDVAYTEGADMQEGHIVVNFSVTPDPLAMSQRVGRAYRIGQKQNVQIFSFAVMNELEGYALAYYNKIGLLDSNEGDATIIAGSNSERMVAVQCPACKQMRLYPSDEFAELKRKDLLYCDEKEICRAVEGKKTALQEINIYEFQCDKCGKKLFRHGGEDDGYRCFAKNNSARGRLTNKGEKGNRKYGCTKLCAIKHCNKIAKFGKDGYDGVACELLKSANEDTPLSQLALICGECPNFESGLCKRECTMMEDIDSCQKCRSASCTPKPHSFTFDENWVSPCPMDKCEDGHLRPILAHTFATYIRSSFKFDDGGASFCPNLLKEAEHVDDIRKILERKKRS